MSPEVQYLLDLMHQLESQGSRDWGPILHTAKQLLSRGDLSVEDLAYINLCVCRSHLYQLDYHAAIPAGELARKLALDQGLWELLGHALAALGGGYVYIRQYNKALERCIEFLEFSHRFGRVRLREGEIWQIVGYSQKYEGHLIEAIAAYSRARVLLEQQGHHNWALTAAYRQFECILEVQPELAPELLREIQRLARANPDRPFASLLLALAKGKYRINRGQPHLAIRAGTAALRLTRNSSAFAVQICKAELCLLLASVFRSIGEDKDALGYALAARMYATQTRQYALEFESVEFIYRAVTASKRDAVKFLDKEYLQIGVDLASLLGGSIVGERGN